jgi:hypothetical protein
VIGVTVDAEDKAGKLSLWETLTDCVVKTSSQKADAGHTKGLLHLFPFFFLASFRAFDGVVLFKLSVLLSFSSYPVTSCDLCAHRDWSRRF